MRRSVKLNPLFEYRVLERFWRTPTTFWALTGARCQPKPRQRPVPLVVGGSGERRTLRVVARHAEEWSFPGGDLADGPARFARLSGILDGHCEAIGRDPGTVRRSVTLRPALTRPRGRGMLGMAVIQRPTSGGPPQRGR
jgi:alkanesulfonate monooxygenase SsuD/methylene tetrahydromethanopterin reductase-like flavin-dependent oxidoreductase (luciferase family)